MHTNLSQQEVHLTVQLTTNQELGLCWTQAPVQLPVIFTVFLKDLLLVLTCGQQGQHQPPAWFCIHAYIKHRECPPLTRKCRQGGFVSCNLQGYKSCSSLC